MKSVGPYVIERELGRGGMGVVYLGRDPRLERPVAIKGIAKDFLNDPVQIGRLQREARLLAQLSHPNIVTIFSIEEQEGARYLVMEYVEGADLTERLAGGRLTYQEALSTCLQVARAVEAAHAAGVIHRDLKPGNVKVAPGGRVKVLDFGLARSGPTEPPKADPDSPTISVGAYTSHGSILGTPGYMSPEQARSQPIDKRTDIFSFGCILYECLTGKRAFWSKTVADAMAATLTSEPDYGAIPRDVSPKVREALTLCLKKQVEDRAPVIGIIADAIEEALESSRITGSPTAPMLDTRPMPRPRTSLIGRTPALSGLLGLIRKSRLVTVVGPGGIGKTRLINRLAADLRDKAGAAIGCVELAGIAGAQGLVRAAAQALHVNDADCGGSLGRALKQCPSGKSLLFLDDWDLMGDACVSAVGEALEAAPGARIVLVGRDTTGIQGEEVMRPPPLDVPPDPLPASESELRSFDGFRLFLDRIPEREPPFELTLHNRAEIARIVRRLAGMPLAIEVVAARATSLSPERILRDIEGLLRSLIEEGSGTTQRSAIVRAAVKWSFDLLSPREQLFLTRISGLIGGFSAEDAMRIVAQDSREGTALSHLTLRDTADVLDSLAAKALITYDAGPDGDMCFGVHQSVRRVALKQASGQWAS